MRMMNIHQQDAFALHSPPFPFCSLAATFVPVKLVDSPQSHARQAAVCIQLPGGIVVQIYAEDR
jgi:hypothetical protein